MRRINFFVLLCALCISGSSADGTSRHPSAKGRGAHSVLSSHASHRSMGVEKRGRSSWDAYTSQQFVALQNDLGVNTSVDSEVCVSFLSLF